MITKEKALEISNLTIIDQIDGMNLIQRYVYDRKNREILINPCTTILQTQIYHHMVCDAKEWYLTNEESI